MILLIDNYDSFSYNLYQLIGSIEPNITIVRNDEITLEQITQLKPTAIIISPGPGRPKDAGIIEKIIAQFHQTIPILGICLGHQAICEVFGAQITYAPHIMHGKSSLIKTQPDPIFQGMNQHLTVARYHSLIAKNLPHQLKVIAQTKEGEIMAVKHQQSYTYGLQFHPESILTQDGTKIIQNFLGGIKND